MESLNGDENDLTLTSAPFQDGLGAEKGCNILDCEDDNESLFLGNIPPQMSENNILELFAPYGVTSVAPLKPVKGRIPSCFSFIQFSSKNHADTAFRYNRFVWNGISLRLGRAICNRRLHVGSFSPDTNEAELRDLFEQFGELADNGVLVFRRKESLEKSSFAVISYKLRKSAAEARSRLNLSAYKEFTLRVEWYRAPKLSNEGSRVSGTMSKESHAYSASKMGVSARSTDPSSLQRHHPVSLYIQFETLKPQVYVDETTILGVFQEFGEPENVFLKSHFVSLNDRKQFGYGFVHYDGGSDGQGARSAYNASQVIGNGSRKNGRSSSPQFVRGDVLFRCELSRNFFMAVGFSPRPDGLMPSRSNRVQRSDGNSISAPIQPAQSGSSTIPWPAGRKVLVEDEKIRYSTVPIPFASMSPAGTPQLTLPPLYPPMQMVNLEAVNTVTPAIFPNGYSPTNGGYVYAGHSPGGAVSSHNYFATGFVTPDQFSGFYLSHSPSHVHVGYSQPSPTPLHYNAVGSTDQGKVFRPQVGRR